MTHFAASRLFAVLECVSVVSPSSLISRATDDVRLISLLVMKKDVSSERYTGEEHGSRWFIAQDKRLRSVSIAVQLPILIRTTCSTRTYIYATAILLTPQRSPPRCTLYHGRHPLHPRHHALGHLHIRHHQLRQRPRPIQHLGILHVELPLSVLAHNMHVRDPLADEHALDVSLETRPGVQQRRIEAFEPASESGRGGCAAQVRGVRGGQEVVRKGRCGGEGHVVPGEILRLDVSVYGDVGDGCGDGAAVAVEEGGFDFDFEGVAW